MYFGYTFVSTVSMLWFGCAKMFLEILKVGVNEDSWRKFFPFPVDKLQEVNSGFKSES